MSFFTQIFTRKTVGQQIRAIEQNILKTQSKKNLVQAEIKTAMTEVNGCSMMLLQLVGSVHTSIFQSLKHPLRMRGLRRSLQDLRECQRMLLVQCTDHHRQVMDYDNHQYGGHYRDRHPDEYHTLEFKKEEEQLNLDSFDRMVALRDHLRGELEQVQAVIRRVGKSQSKNQLEFLGERRALRITLS